MVAFEFGCRMVLVGPRRAISLLLYMNGLRKQLLAMYDLHFSSFLGNLWLLKAC